jgi:hypothetical protein
MALTAMAVGANNNQLNTAAEKNGGHGGNSNSNNSRHNQ